MEWQKTWTVFTWRHIRQYTASPCTECLYSRSQLEARSWHVLMEHIWGVCAKEGASAWQGNSLKSPIGVTSNPFVSSCTMAEGSLSYIVFAMTPLVPPRTKSWAKRRAFPSVMLSKKSTSDLCCPTSKKTQEKYSHTRLDLDPQMEGTKNILRAPTGRFFELFRGVFEIGSFSEPPRGGTGFISSACRSLNRGSRAVLDSWPMVMITTHYSW